MNIIAHKDIIYNVVAKGNTPSDIQQVGPYDSLAPGSNILVKIHLKSYLLPSVTSHMFDLAYLGELAGRKLAPAHVKVQDVYESGGKVYIKGVVTGSPLLPILVAVGVACMGIAFLVSTIEIGSDMPEIARDIASGFSAGAKGVGSAIGSIGNWLPWAVGGIALVVVARPLMERRR